MFSYLLVKTITSFYRHDKLIKLSECECTGLNPRWQNVRTDTKFPIKQGEVVVVKCKRKHINLGVQSFTCVKDANFKEIEAEPSCHRIGKL